MEKHQLINQTSGDTEYYSPVELIEAARRLMGSIDLDPASSENANKKVRATKFYTKEDNGLMQPWFGNIWMNHPFGRVQNPLWINKLRDSYYNSDECQAVCLTYACTSEKWFQPLLTYPQCFLCPRTNYFLPDGTLKKGVTKGSVITYFGTNFEDFVAIFSKFGVVK